MASRPALVPAVITSFFYLLGMAGDCRSSLKQMQLYLHLSKSRTAPVARPFIRAFDLLLARRCPHLAESRGSHCREAKEEPPSHHHRGYACTMQMCVPPILMHYSLGVMWHASHCSLVTAYSISPSSVPGMGSSKSTWKVRI